MSTTWTDKSGDAKPAGPATVIGSEGGGNSAPTGPRDELRPGQLLDGRFIVRALEQRSGMAAVYRAEDRLDGHRLVALKVPLLKYESSPADFARFLHEESIGRGLDHPAVIRLSDVPNKSRPYIAMEFLEGRTLERRLREDTRPSEVEALALASRICTALEYLHAHRVVHRDLKPSNVMLCDDQTLRVFDLGLAAPPQRERTILAKLTHTFGTPQYMAPEQVDNAAIDERADIYALGAILYEMLTGQVPFLREDRWDSAYARLNGDPVAPRTLNPNLSPEAEEIVLRALRMDPHERYQTAAAFKADLDAPGKVTITGLCDRLKEPRWRFSFQATPILAGLVMGVGSVLTLIVAFFVFRFALK
jgi:serine/threonine-protein kinase